MSWVVVEEEEAGGVAARRRLASRQLRGCHQYGSSVPQIGSKIEFIQHCASWQHKLARAGYQVYE
jgi:hypothetical protein